MTQALNKNFWKQSKTLTTSPVFVSCSDNLPRTSANIITLELICNALAKNGALW